MAHLDDAQFQALLQAARQGAADALLPAVQAAQAAAANAAQIAQAIQPAAGAPAAAAAAPAAGHGSGLKIEPLTVADPVEWTYFRARFEKYVNHKQWDGLEAKRALYFLVQNAAATAVEGRVTQAQVNAPVAGAAPAGGWANNDPNRPFTLLNMLETWEACFLAGRGAQQAVGEFEDAAQAVGETTQCFHGRLFTIYVRAYPNVPAENRNTDMNLIRRFLGGMRDREAAKIVASTKNPLLYTQALKIGRAHV